MLITLLTRVSHSTLLGLGILVLSLPSQAQIVPIANFSQGDLKQWEEKAFVKQTDYAIVNDGEKQVLKAHTQASASGLFKKIDIDLSKTPYLNWSWRADSIYKGHNEQTTDGDDYPVRIYVVVSGGWFFWQTRALNYVWSSNQEKNTVWPNAYTSRAKMIAIRSGKQSLGQWLTEKRDIRADFKRYFGENIDEINAIAVMSDSDNTGQSATAYYGDIFFSSD